LTKLRGVAESQDAEITEKRPENGSIPHRTFSNRSVDRSASGKFRQSRFALSNLRKFWKKCVGMRFVDPCLVFAPNDELLITNQLKYTSQNIIH
jgi:hypothetical protein